MRCNIRPPRLYPAPLFWTAVNNYFVPTAGQQFTVLSAGNIVDNGLVLGGPAASSFNLLIGSSSALAAGLPGDHNGDGTVNAADYVLRRKSDGTPTGYNAWRTNFGPAAGGGAVAQLFPPMRRSLGRILRRFGCCAGFCWPRSGGCVRIWRVVLSIVAATIVSRVCLLEELCSEWASLLDWQQLVGHAHAPVVGSNRVRRERLTKGGAMSATRSVFSRFVLVTVAIWGVNARAELLDPLAFTSLGTLNLAGGSFTIDTDALTISDSGGVLFTGVLDDQHGLADSFGLGGDVTTVGPLGIPHIAVFTFDAIDLASTASITVAGHRALALLSQGDAQFATTIDVSGADATDGGFGTAGQRGEAGPGGFAGGGRGQAGFGPGGGGLGTGFTAIGGGAGFGSDGSNGLPPGTAGVSYGGLAGLLQGGSGGGGTSTEDIYGAAGGGGGGAIEIGAAGLLAFVDASILANGGVGGFDNSFTGSNGGNGSGGGIRLHGAPIEFLGTTNIEAMGAGPSGGGLGGGGRVLVPAEEVTVVVGDPLDVSTLLGAIDVSPGDSPLNHGVVTVLPELTIVPGGQIYHLGQATELQSATTTQPGVEVLAGNVQVTGSGELRLPFGEYTNQYSIELRSPAASVTNCFGPCLSTLINAGELRGTGSFDVTLVNAAGGEINLINDQLTFNFFAVTNSAGGQINAINSTLNFDAGLVNDGEMNLINSTVSGTVTSSETIALAGSNTFTGDVSGAGDFIGSGEVLFAGSYSPGNSPVAVSFEGDLNLADTNTLFIEIGGPTLGDDYDSLTIAGDAMLDGILDVSLINSFEPTAGQQFTVLSAGNIVVNGLVLGGPAASSFSMLVDSTSVILQALAPGLPGDHNNDGSVDAADYVVWRKTDGTPTGYQEWRSNFGATLGSGANEAAAVPEPASLLLLALSAIFATLISDPAHREPHRRRPRQESLRSIRR